jgi:hypothetical protein
MGKSRLARVSTGELAAAAAAAAAAQSTAPPSDNPFNIFSNDNPRESMSGTSRRVSFSLAAPPTAVLVAAGAGYVAPQLEAAAGGGRTSAAPALPCLAVRTTVLSPQTLASQRLFGAYADTSGRWQPGVIPAVAKRAARELGEALHWLVLDGPFEGVWLDHVSSAVARPHNLTLANGERLALPDNLSLIFETTNLANSSPGLLCQCGFVVLQEQNQHQAILEAQQLPVWARIVHAWISNFLRDALLSEEIRNMVRVCFFKNIFIVANYVFLFFGFLVPRFSARFI